MTCKPLKHRPAERDSPYYIDSLIAEALGIFWASISCFTRFTEGFEEICNKVPSPKDTSTLCSMTTDTDDGPV